MAFSYQARTSGLFNSKNISFQIKSTPMNWTVKRTVEDFVWLRNCLATMYPNTLVPPPPPKPMKNTADPGLLLQHYLQRALDSILKNSLLRTSPYLLSFLKDSDVKAFAQMKKEGSKNKKPVGFQENWSLTGTVVCDPLEIKEKDKERREYIAQTEFFRKRLKKLSEALIKRIFKVSAGLQDIAGVFQQLEGIQYKFAEVRNI